MATKSASARRTPPPTFQSRKPTAKPAPRFKTLRNGIVRDSLLNLDWGKTLPQSFTHADAEKAVAALGKGWRLPTVDELLTLVDRTCFKPATHKAFKADTKSDWYWTSTPAASDPAGSAWIVGCYYGVSVIYNRGSRAWVRPVRASQ